MKIDISEIKVINNNLKTIGGDEENPDGELAMVCKNINEELENVSNNITSGDLRASISNLKERIESLTVALAPSVARVSEFLNQQMEAYTITNEEAQSSLESLISQITSAFVVYSAAPTPPVTPEPTPAPVIEGGPMSETTFNAMISASKKYMGWHYKQNGLVCSNFVTNVLRGAGYNLKLPADNVRSLDAVCTKVDTPEPGDLVFLWNTWSGADPRYPSHVGIYVGNGKMLHNGSSSGVSYSKLSDWKEERHFGRLPSP